MCIKKKNSHIKLTIDKLTGYEWADNKIHDHISSKTRKHFQRDFMSLRKKEIRTGQWGKRKLQTKTVIVFNHPFAGTVNLQSAQQRWNGRGRPKTQLLESQGSPELPREAQASSSVATTNLCCHKREEPYFLRNFLWFEVPKRSSFVCTYLCTCTGKTHKYT